MEFFLKFDIFTVNSFFQYDSNKKVASYPGLFFSLIVFIFLLYTFIKSDMIQRVNPKIIDLTIADPTHGLNSGISNKNVFPIISIFDENQTYYRYFDPSN